MKKYLPRVNVGGLFFDNLKMDEALLKMEEKISNYKEEYKTNFILIANQDILNQIKKYQSLYIDILNRSFLTVADGYSIVYASKFLKTPLKERVAGPDLMFNFIKISNIKGYKNFFLGAKEGVADTMAQKFLKRFPNIQIEGIYSPPFCEKFSEHENNKIIEMVNNSKTDILWVSFGCPKQEIWIIENLDRLKVPLVVGVGAAFDFHSQNIKRAPKIVQNMRIEWLYRILKEPKRLWKRYFNGGIEFTKLILRQKRENNKTKYNRAEKI